MALKNHSEKRGLAQLGRIDRGHLKPGVFVGMHPHKNDEILSYVRSGNLVHEDSEGDSKIVSNTRLMMMNAGSGIYHQESIPEDGDDVHMLQIFLRPAEDDVTPSVQFHDFEAAYNVNSWRQVAGSFDTDVPLKINADAAVFDARIDKIIQGQHAEDKTYYLYVFDGTIDIDGQMLLKGDSLVYENESIRIVPAGIADLVLFELDKNKPYSRNGMYSGV
ncbi:pirin family protein [Aquimarina sp. U1-2]|uniref:pirin family protein n=1 Tax=Aquimarina sp. U1-2 TaxID=2823141 RepID=UPI001AEC7CB6|nr:pirin family protein [Aquimarina sp. U1-2]MBP2833106.1 pirin family protein [Aquimarina sp. U1-2]